MTLFEEVVFCLPTAGWRTQFFHPIFTQPGKSLLVQPCTSNSRFCKLFSESPSVVYLPCCQGKPGELPEKMCAISMYEVFCHLVLRHPLPRLLDPDDGLPGVGPEAGVLPAHHSPPADVGPPAHRVVDHRPETDVLQPGTKSKKNLYLLKFPIIFFIG